MFVSAFLPPLETIGAVYTGKLGEFWRASGHDVRRIAIALLSNENAGKTLAIALENDLGPVSVDPNEIKGMLVLGPTFQGQTPSNI